MKENNTDNYVINVLPIPINTTVPAINETPGIPLYLQRFLGSVNSNNKVNNINITVYDNNPYCAPLYILEI